MTLEKCLLSRTEESAHGAETGDVPLCGTGMNPHFLFALPKRKRPFTVKRKGRLIANRHRLALCRFASLRELL